MCCGKKRQALTTTPPGDRTERPPPTMKGAVYLRYFGTQALTTVGPVSGRVYRFAGPGATHAVDPADAPSLSGIPNMRRIANL